jgi:hypothetical protein
MDERSVNGGRFPPAAGWIFPAMSLGFTGDTATRYEATTEESLPKEQAEKQSISEDSKLPYGPASNCRETFR